jgi:tetratricopeptide (TPR) repeat protein
MSEQNRAIAVHELDQKLSKHIELLNQQVAELPTPETLGSLKKALLIKNREVFERLSQDLSTAQKEIQERLDPIEKQNLGGVRRDIGALQEQYRNLNDLIIQLNDRIQELSASDRVEDLDRLMTKLRADTDQIRAGLQSLSEQTKPTLTSLQEQVNHLNQQFRKLPAPFDSTALKQEVAELIRVVADLVPKRDWSNLLAEMQALQQQQESHAQNEESLRRKLQELSQQLQGSPAKSSLSSLQNQINHLHQQFKQLPPPFDASSLKQEVAELIQMVADRVPKRDWNALLVQVRGLQKQQIFQMQVEETLRRELREINRQIETFVAQSEGSSLDATEAELNLEETVLQPQRQFQERIEETLQRELKAIEQQLQALPSGSQLQAEIEATLRRELQEINQHLRVFPSDPHYELVFDFKSSLPSEGVSDSSAPAAHSSRTVLEEALAVTQERLLLIWPWSSQCPLDDALLDRMDAFLSQGRSLDLGWCHQAEREPRFLQNINQRWAIQPRQKELQETLQRLLRLKQTYPDQFQFQILGTSENFLVSDQQFAVLGTDDSLIQNSLFPDLELKLRTTDREVIQQLIHRFDHPVIHPEDVTAYWNRAVTRYDLGDKQGALADFNQVLAGTPNDAIAYNYRGLVRFDLGDREGASSDFGHAIDLDPEFITAYCNRGFVASEMGDQLGAIADFSLAIQAQPDSAIAFFYRGLAGQKIGDLQGALTDYNAAIQLIPDAPQCYYYRGITLQKLQNFEGAIADFEQAAELFMQRGNKANADKAVKNLSRLQQALDIGTLRSMPIDEGTSPVSPAELPTAELPTAEPTEDASIVLPVESEATPSHPDVPSVAVDRAVVDETVVDEAVVDEAAVDEAVVDGVEFQNGMAIDTLESFVQTIEQPIETAQNGKIPSSDEAEPSSQSVEVANRFESNLLEPVDIVQVFEPYEAHEEMEQVEPLALHSIDPEAIAPDDSGESSDESSDESSGSDTLTNHFDKDTHRPAEHSSSSGTETISSFFYGSDTDSDLAETGWSGGTLIELFESVEAEVSFNGHYNNAIADTPIDIISASALDAAAQRLHQRTTEEAIAASFLSEQSEFDPASSEEGNALVNFFENLSVEVDESSTDSTFQQDDDSDDEESPYYAGIGSEYAESFPLTVAELRKWF